MIGGDSYYKDQDEKARFVISRWARRKVASQFRDEYLDGRESFIFSWDQKHRPIHEEALRHYLDPSKRGCMFEYTPLKPLPKPKEPEVTIPAKDQGNEVWVASLLLWVGLRLSLRCEQQSAHPGGTPRNSWWGWAARFSKSWPYFRRKHVIFHTRFQTWPLKSIPVYKRPKLCHQFAKVRTPTTDLVKFSSNDLFWFILIYFDLFYVFVWFIYFDLF